MLTFPKIQTPRLKLTQVQWTDIPKIVAYAGDERISATTMNIPFPYETKDAIFWIHAANKGFADQSQYTFAIRLQPTDEFIGGIGLKINQRFNRAGLGYWLAHPYWNRGYMTEAVQAILEFGFTTLELNKIYATHLAENPASGKVMLKNGMIKEGVLKDHFKKGKTYLSIVQYRLTRSEFEGKA